MLTRPRSREASTPPRTPRCPQPRSRASLPTARDRAPDMATKSASAPVAEPTRLIHRRARRRRKSVVHCEESTTTTHCTRTAHDPCSVERVLAPREQRDRRGQRATRRPVIPAWRRTSRIRPCRIPQRPPRRETDDRRLRFGEAARISHWMRSRFASRPARRRLVCFICRLLRSALTRLRVQFPSLTSGRCDVADTIAAAMRRRFSPHRQPAVDATCNCHNCAIPRPCFSPHRARAAAKRPTKDRVEEVSIPIDRRGLMQLELRGRARARYRVSIPIDAGVRCNRRCRHETSSAAAGLHRVYRIVSSRYAGSA